MFREEYTKTINQLDTIDFAIPFLYCDFDCCMPQKGRAIGAYYYIEKDRIHFNLSSKLFAKPTSLGAITINNVEEITQKLKSLFEIEVDTEYLCTQAEMYRVHTKKDPMLNNHASMYIPYINASFKRLSDKFIFNKFKDIKYEHGLSASPKGNKKIRYSIYNKGFELAKARNKEFREIFDYDYLLSLVKVLRCEIQIGGYEEVRNLFKLKSGTKPTLENILNSPVDVIANEFSQIIEPDVWQCGVISDKKQGSLHNKMLNLQREAICDQFDNDIKDIRWYLRYSLNARPNEVSNEIKIFKNMVTSLCNCDIDQNLMRELVDKLGENCYEC